MGEPLLPSTIEEFTAGDGYRWRYRRYLPIGQARAHIVGIHGIQSHGDWYKSSCQWLATLGYAVSFLDRRGAGLNEEARGDTPSFRRLLDDVAEFLCSLWAKAETDSDTNPTRKRGGSQPPRLGVGLVSGSSGSAATIPVFLMAISWGGKLATALQRRHPGLVDGLALLCPGFFSQVKPSLNQRLSVLWAHLTGPKKLLRIPLDDPGLFTTSPQWQTYIATDPLGLRYATARLLFESVRLDGYLRFVARHVSVPVLLMLAEEDRIIRNEPTRRFVERFATRDREIIEYAGAHHTLEFEPQPETWRNDLAQWLDRRLEARRLNASH